MMPNKKQNEPAEDAEFDSFEDLTRNLLKVPKSDVDKLRDAATRQQPKEPKSF